VACVRAAGVVWRELSCMRRANQTRPSYMSPSTHIIVIAVVRIQTLDRQEFCESFKPKGARAPSLSYHPAPAAPCTCMHAPVPPHVHFLAGRSFAIINPTHTPPSHHACKDARKKEKPLLYPAAAAACEG
jgi:hypothetical protein